MSAALQAGALLCSVLGVLAAGAVLLRARRVRPALGVLVDLLLAAALLRLADDPGWQDVTAAAVAVGLRTLVPPEQRPRETAARLA